MSDYLESILEITIKFNSKYQTNSNIISGLNLSLIPSSNKEIHQIEIRFNNKTKIRIGI